jgi:hypothetical protein
MKIQIPILFLLLILLLGGCSTAKVQNAWKDPEYSEKTTSILVVGVAIRKGRRQIFEATLAKKLKAAGVRAIPSYTVFPKEEIKEQEAADFIKEKNIDSIIVVKVLNSEAIKQRAAYTTYVTRSSPVGMNPYNRGFSGWQTEYRYWQTVVDTYDTNYVISNLEANLYRQGNKKMVWSALVETNSFDSDKSGVEALANALIKQMRKDRLI